MLRVSAQAVVHYRIVEYFGNDLTRMDLMSLAPPLFIGSILLAIIFTSKCYRIHFYEPREAKCLFTSANVSKLIDTYKPMECVARSGGRASSPHDMIRQYMLAVRSFSEDERRRLRAIIQLFPELRARAWKFVKVASYMDFGYPYTLEDVVILPSTFLRHHSRHEAAVTLLHESLHIEQRADPSRFNRYYKTVWGYTRPKRLLIPMDIWERTVTDPDAPDIKWVRKMDNDFWWMALSLHDQQHHPVGMAYRCAQERPGHYRVTADSRPISSMTSHFFGETDVYHPNELYASVYSKL